MLKISSVAVCLLPFLVASAAAQQQGQPSEKKPPEFRREGQAIDQGRRQRPVYIQGKVVTDDGIVPTEQVLVDLVCNGSVYRQSYTSASGAFSFEVGTSRQVVPTASMDASVSTPPSNLFGSNARKLSAKEQNFGGGHPLSFDSLNLATCELQAHLPGFRSEKVPLGVRKSLDNPDVGLIVLYRLGSGHGTVVSRSTLQAPKKARQAFDKAVKELKKKKTDYSKAARSLERAVQRYPQFAEAWNLLGEIRLALRDGSGAREAFRRSVAEEPNYITPYLSLAKIQVRRQEWEDVARLTNRVIELSPDLTQAYYFNAVAGVSLGQFEMAEERIRHVRQSSEAANYPVAHYLLGMIMVKKGDVAAAASEFRQFLQVNRNPKMVDPIRKQLQEWEELGLIGNATSGEPN